MKLKNLFNTVLLILFTLGILFYMRSHKKVKPEGFPWAEVRKDTLVQFELESFSKNTAEAYTLVKEDGIWILSKPDFYATRPEMITFLINAFMNLKPKEILSNVSVEEYNAYGFNQPQIKMSVKIKNKPNINLLLGADTGIGENIYVAIESDRETAFVIAKKEGDIFLQGMNALINNQILSENTDELSALQFRNFKNEELFFTKIDGFWVETPSGNKDKDWGLRRFLFTIQDLVFNTNTILYRVHPEQVLEQGIDIKNAPMLSLTFQDKKTSSIYIGSSSKGVYKVYIPEMKILSIIPESSIYAVFSTTTKDLEVKKK